MILHENFKVSNKGITLEWLANGDVVVVRTGNPLIDDMPPAMRAITEEYQHAHQRRFDILFEILTTNPPVRNAIRANPRSTFQRLNALIRRRLIDSRKLKGEIESELVLLITNVLWDVDTKSSVRLVWRLIENYPDLISFPIGDRLYTYYSSSPKHVSRLRQAIQKRPHLTALETPILQYVLITFAHETTSGRIDSPQILRLLTETLNQYRSRLIQYLDGAAAWSEETIHNGRFIHDEIIAPVTSLYRYRRGDPVYETLYDAALDTLGTYQLLEEVYERREKTG